jgi:hypothetical protein
MIMKTCASTPGILGGLLRAAFGLAVAVPALASPMKYSATLVTDIKVGEQRYHNAAVTFTFVGDTNDIAAVVDKQGNQITSTFCTPGTGWFFWLTKGGAAFSVHSQEHILHGHFEPGQLFVALDACNGGIGFGSYTGPSGMEVAYPVAYTLGTAMTAAVTSGLSSPAHMSGNAWSCIGYPPNGAGNLPSNNGFCIDPSSYPLHSDVGDVFVYLPYTLDNPDGSIIGNHVGTLNRGTFSITPAIQEQE